MDGANTSEDAMRHDTMWRTGVGGSGWRQKGDNVCLVVLCASVFVSAPVGASQSVSQSCLVCLSVRLCGGCESWAKKGL